MGWLCPEPGRGGARSRSPAAARSLSLALANGPLCQQLRTKAGGAALFLPPHRARNVQVAPLHLQAVEVGRPQSGG